MKLRTATEQGSTFLWTESYGDDDQGTTVLEALRDVTVSAALLVLAAGAAGFLVLPATLR